MATLADSIQVQKLTEKQRVIKLSRCAKELSLAASAEELAVSDKFFMVRIALDKLPLLAAEGSESTKGAIVVDINASKRHKTGSGYIPKVIILGGLQALQKLKANKEIFCNAWLGQKALKKLSIMADDAIGCNELTKKIQVLLNEKYKKNSSSDKGDCCSYPSPSPWITEVYPFENYAIFQMSDDTYKQVYKLDPVSRIAELVGEAVQVYTEYATIPKGLQSSKMVKAGSPLSDSIYGDPEYLSKTMMKEAMYDVPNYRSPAVGGFANQGGAPVDVDCTYYPAGSELSNPSIRTMLNTQEALSIYLNVLKNGSWKPLQNSFAPVQTIMYASAMSEAIIAAKLAKVKIDEKDFIAWQHHVLSARGPRLKDGLTVAAYAYVGEATDISTWHLKCDTLEHIEKSLKRVFTAAGIPNSKREEVKASLKKKRNKMKADFITNNGSKKTKASNSSMADW